MAHCVLWEYLAALDDLPDVTERENLRHEVFESCQDVLAEMVHTKEASRSVREFLAHGTAKDRKQILKAIKPYVETMAKDEDAQLVLFTALDATEHVLLFLVVIHVVDDLFQRYQATLKTLGGTDRRKCRTTF